MLPPPPGFLDRSLLYILLVLPASHRRVHRPSALFAVEGVIGVAVLDNCERLHTKSLPCGDIVLTSLFTVLFILYPRVIFLVPITLFFKMPKSSSVQGVAYEIWLAEVNKVILWVEESTKAPRLAEFFRVLWMAYRENGLPESLEEFPQEWHLMILVVDWNFFRTTQNASFCTSQVASFCTTQVDTWCVSEYRRIYYVDIGGGLAFGGLIVAMVCRIYPGEGQQGLFRFVYVYIRSIAFGESLEQVGEFQALGSSYKELFGDNY